MINHVSDAVRAVVNSMEDSKPRNLLKLVNARLDADDEPAVDETSVVDFIVEDNVNAPVRITFHIKLGKWTSAPALDVKSFDSVAVADTSARREEVFRALGLSEVSVERLRETFPLLEDSVLTVIQAEDWDPWYPKPGSSTFYWDQYKSVLESKGFNDDALDNLEESTTAVIGRLADPARDAPYQSKGLVMGYVQSGKTANFAGTIAKAIDAGYKLIVVLTGTIELLRSQTQKRLDKELVGTENVFWGVAPNVREIDRKISELDPDNPGSAAQLAKLEAERASITEKVDYVSTGDLDWAEGKFARFGLDPRTVGAPRIFRLTGVKDDYKRLQQNLHVMDFRMGLKDPSRPLYDPENLETADVRFAVIKKSTTALKKLSADLKSLETKLGEIPVLIIDDEADQASVNTKNNKNKLIEDRERTAINGHIAEILESMPRAQYVAYTATPFANVFVDPEDAGDIFPKDFIVALDPSPEYMGAKAYHDLDGQPEDPTFENSNKKAYYRPVYVDESGNVKDDGLIAALDAYVLSGAIKLYRRDRMEDPGSLTHHTMMVHEGARTQDHTETRNRVAGFWLNQNYGSPSTMARLQNLWATDFEPVSKARSAGAPIPVSFDELKTYIGAAVSKINRGRVSEGQPAPVVLVNGTKDSVYRQADIDFDGGEVWKILVGGTKLSRGFTVEGLTVTLYSRVTVAADTLMQMGRWFGYRKHYRDLVRLYIADEITKGRKLISLYDAFTDIARDEEDFRSELRQFASLNSEGKPQVRPMDVPPLVTQRIPWMKPTGANKMYNSVIHEQGIGGQLVDFFAMPEWKTRANERNLARVATLLRDVTDEGQFLSDSGTPYDVRYGVVSAHEVVKFLESFEFFDAESYASKVNFIRARSSEESQSSQNRIEDFVVALPKLSGKNLAVRSIPGIGEIPVLKRARRSNRNDFSGSSLRQRTAFEVIAGQTGFASGTGGMLAESLRKPYRGALMLTLAADQSGRVSEPEALPPIVDPRDIVSLLSVAVPFSSAPKGVIVRSVRNTNHANEAVVDSE